MIDGLIITSDNLVFEEFNNDFSSEQNHFEYADSLESAYETLDMSMPDYIFVIEKDIKDIKNIIMNLHNHEEYSRIPVICFMPRSSYSERQGVWQYGTKDIIQLPILKSEFEVLLNQIHQDIIELDVDHAEVGMKGKLEDYNPIDLVQIFEQNKKTGILTLNRFDEEGRIWFYQGKIYDGKYRNFESIDAVLNLMTWIEGDFSIVFVDDEYEHKIQLDNEQILLETIQRIDNRNKIFNVLPNRDVILLTSPEIDPGEIEENDNTFLQFFKSGNTIFDFLYEFDYDELFLLEKIKLFIEKKFIMTRAEIDSYKMNMEKETKENAGLKKVIKRIFKKKDKGKKKTAGKIKEQTENVQETENVIEEEDQKYSHIFSLDDKELDYFRTQIKKL